MFLVIYINKVAVCLFVCLSGTFSFTIVTITQVLVQIFTTRGKAITYFNVTITKVESRRSRNDLVEWKWQFPFSRQERPLFQKDHHNLFHQAMPDSCQPVSIFLFLSLNILWILLPSILRHVDFCLYAQCTLILQ